MSFYEIRQVNIYINVFNQLKEYRKTKGTKATYEYLPNNYRYSKTVGSTKTKFLWDGDYVAGELDSTGNISKKYFYGLDMLSDDSGNNYVYDIHGSVTDVLNSNGTKTNTYEYNAFGKDESGTSAKTSNAWQYCGEYKDSESGLIYLRNRYYDPETGRFINEDPIRSGGNWYSYASQNPIMFIDPSGLTTNRGGEFFEEISKFASNNTLISRAIEGIDFKSFQQSNGTTVWYTDSECWQKSFGYNNFYDTLADNSGISIMGMDIHAFNIITKKFYFDYNGTVYRLQIWKGRYFLGIGAEMGIYTNTGGAGSYDLRHYKASDVDYYRAIQLRDSSNNRQIFYRDDKTWWINGFIADNASLNDLTVDAQIYFPDEGMAIALQNSINEERKKPSNQDVTVSRYKGVVNITWSSQNFSNQDKK